MHQHVFKANLFMSFIVPAIVFVILFVLYLFVNDMPSWVLLFLLLPVIMVLAAQKTKVIIEDDILRYQQLFSSQEAALTEVTQIVTREVETLERDSDNREQRVVRKVVYVLDDSGRTFFSFPANLIGLKNRSRFKEAVKSVNPSIIII